jgi:hypothetical protein
MMVTEQGAALPRCLSELSEPLALALLLCQTLRRKYLPEQTAPEQERLVLW